MILLLECQAITIRSRIFNWVKILLRISAAAAASLQSCPTLCDSIDGSPPGSPVPGILQARTLEWVAISFSNAWKWKVKVKSLSCARLLATPWTAAYQAPPSMGFSRRVYVNYCQSSSTSIAQYFINGSMYYIHQRKSYVESDTLTGHWVMGRIWEEN